MCIKEFLVGDKCLGVLEAVREVFPEAKYQLPFTSTAMCSL